MERKHYIDQTKNLFHGHLNLALGCHFSSTYCMEGRTIGSSSTFFSKGNTNTSFPVMRTCAKCKVMHDTGSTIMGKRSMENAARPTKTQAGITYEGWGNETWGLWANRPVGFISACNWCVSPGKSAGGRKVWSKMWKYGLHTATLRGGAV